VPVDQVAVPDANTEGEEYSAGLVDEKALTCRADGDAASAA
jgi:hypothetical protein